MKRTRAGCLGLETLSEGRSQRAFCRLEDVIVRVKGVTSVSLESPMLHAHQPAPDSPVVPVVPQCMSHHNYR